MTKDEITALALANGFKLKEQPDGSMALNTYVFDFARALEKAVLERAAKYVRACHTQDCRGMNKNSLIKRASRTADTIASELECIADGEQPLRAEYDGTAQPRHLYGYAEGRA
jgi:hypothetical protein